MLSDQGAARWGGASIDPLECEKTRRVGEHGDNRHDMDGQRNHPAVRRAVGLHRENSGGLLLFIAARGCTDSRLGVTTLHANKRTHEARRPSCRTRSHHADQGQRCGKYHGCESGSSRLSYSPPMMPRKGAFSGDKTPHRNGRPGHAAMAHRTPVHTPGTIRNPRLPSRRRCLRGTKYLP